MSENPLKQPAYEFAGGNSCLDFTNTVGGLRGGQSSECLGGYADLVAWAWQAGLVDERVALSLRRDAVKHPTEAGRIFTRALAAREAIYAVFSALAAGRPAPDAALEVINTELPGALGRMRLKASKEGFDWELPADDTGLELPLWAIVREAAELLTSSRRTQVRECSGDTCSWLFLDTTRNHSRLWCDMRGCGNRAKVRRHRAKHA